MTTSSPSLSSAVQPLRDDPLWFKRAVFYELLVRAFQDSNNDGVGDFPGLISRLDYLQWLGINCIWLLPFNQSPLRDGGYDVSDYYDVLPEYGTVDDVRLLLEEAHRRGIRVIMDLVMNHTSDQHPWFQSARSSPSSPYRDWYVWSDTSQRYQDARIILQITFIWRILYSMEQKIVQPQEPRQSRQAQPSPTEAAAREAAKEFFSRVTKRQDVSELLKRLART